MNWKEIKKKYPKVIEMFENSNTGGVRDFPETDGSCYYFKTDCGAHIYYDERDLYDFFDEQGIYIEVGPHLSKFTTFSYLIPHWSVGAAQIVKYDFVNRKEAETAAFTKAFEILENKPI